MSSQQQNKKMNNLDDPKAWSSTLLNSCFPTTSRNIITPIATSSSSSPRLSLPSSSSVSVLEHYQSSTTSMINRPPGPRRGGSVESIFHTRNYRSSGDSRVQQKVKSSNSKCPTSSRDKFTRIMNTGDGHDLDQDPGSELPISTDDESICKMTLNTTSSTKLKCLETDNKMLYDSLDHDRKALMVRKALNSFMYGALKRQSDQLHLVETRVKMKAEECAARLILHSLLLNSYRRMKKDLELAQVEIVQRNKSVENLLLQLRVVRHLQSTEKERAIERAHEISTLKSEVGLLKDELDTSRKKLEVVEKQLHDEQTANDALAREKLQIQEELTGIQEKIDIVNGSLELEKKKVGKYVESSRLLKKQIGECKLQIKELICQSTQWQERARAFEAENWELERQVNNGGQELAQLKTAFDELMDDNRVLITDKDALLQHKVVLESKLKETHGESYMIQQNLTITQAQLENQKTVGFELQTMIMKYKDENLAMKRELFDYKLSHVRKRSAWVQFIMSIINPLETIRLYMLGPSETTVEDDHCEVFDETR